MIRVNVAQIISIDKQGIQYVGDDKKLYLIDFEICQRNWMKRMQQKKSETETTLNDVARDCVGERNVLAKPPYIEFYTDPTTRVEFRFSLFKCWRPMMRYQVLRQRLRKYGWTTLDLT